MMQYRQLGRTGPKVSAIGFGTCQLRLVSEQQAIDTLKKGFDMGVNIVHTAPDYEGADELIAKAIKESGQDVIVLSQGYGDPAHFEWLFETTCKKFGKRQLETFGIACIDDREYLGENVWGRGGMVQSLLKKKKDGRLGSIFCTTHGTPEYIKNLITCKVFDALMLSYNPLGFHLLSYNPEPPRTIEDITRNKTEIFHLAAQHNVGLMIMKPLAGGLLCESKAFPPRCDILPRRSKLSARHILRSILLNKGVSSVFPGTASIEEAEENAFAGHEPIDLSSPTNAEIKRHVEYLKANLCSRCGYCDELCNMDLPVSWLFRDAYINNYPSEPFETIDRLQYFHLHPKETSICTTCQDPTCLCPHGIQIQRSLTDIHEWMLKLRDKGLLPIPAAKLQAGKIGERPFAAEVVRKDIPAILHPRQQVPCTLYIQNTGRYTWAPARISDRITNVVLAIFQSGNLLQNIPLRHPVAPGTRTHFSFDLKGHEEPGTYILGFFLKMYGPGLSSRKAISLLTSQLTVTQSSGEEIICLEK